MKSRLAVIVVVLLVFGGSALAGVSFDVVNYEGYVDLSPLKNYGVNSGNTLSDVNYASAGGELFVLATRGTIAGPPVYCIGLPHAGDTVTMPTRSLGSASYVNNSMQITSISSQGDDVVCGKHVGGYDSSTKWIEDRVGGNLYTYSGNAPGDDRYTWIWHNGPDGRGATLTASSSGGYTPPGWFFGATATSWDKEFQNMVGHGQMNTNHEMRGNYPSPDDGEVGYLEGGKLAFLYVSYDTTENNKRYIEAGEMTWDGAKWVAPGAAEADLSPEDYAPDTAGHSLRITLGEQDGMEKLWVLDTSTSKLHVFNFEGAEPIAEPAGLSAVGLALIALRRRRR